MKKKYLTFLLLLFLVPITNAKAEIRYDLEEVNVSSSNITISGWALKLGQDHCASSGMTVMGEFGQYYYGKSNGAARCGFSRNQPSYKIALVDVKTGKEIASKIATRNGNSMTCVFYSTPSPNQSCYYNPSGYASGGVDMPNSIGDDELKVRNTNIENRGDNYYDGVGWTVTLPTTGTEKGQQYKIRLTVFGESVDLGFQAEKVKGTSDFTLVNAEDTIYIATVGYTGIKGNSGKIILSGGTYANLFNVGKYNYNGRVSSVSNGVHIVYGKQQYYNVATTSGASSSRVSPGSSQHFYVPAAWTRGNNGTGLFTILSRCDPEKDNCELNNEDVQHKEVYCYQGKDTIPTNPADSRTKKPANLYATGVINVNKYCNLSCEEQVVLTFPDDPTVDKAGMAFSFEPLTLEATKTCATNDEGWKLSGGVAAGTRTYGTKFNMPQWVRDWNNVNRQIPSAYTAWAKAWINLEDYEDGYWTSTRHHMSGCKAHDCVSSYDKPYKCNCEKDEETGKRTCDTCYRCICTQYEDEPQYHYRTTYGGSGTVWECQEPARHGRFISAESSTRSRYQNLVQQQQTLLRQLKECNNWTQEFNVEPLVNITIEDPYGNFVRTLSGDSATSSISGSTKNPSVSTTPCKNCARAVEEVECPSPRSLYCWNGAQPTPIYGAWKKVWNFTREYMLPKVWIDAVTGEIQESLPSYTYSPRGGERVYYTNPYTAEGTYKITVNFGTKGQVDGSIKLGMGSKASGVKPAYYTRTLNCTYTINQYTYCDPSDEDCEEPEPSRPTDPDIPPTIIEPYNVSYYFRTVALTDLFPNNRRPGYNWRSNSGLISQIERQGEKLYNGKPKYLITLTPQAMNNVRKSNKDMGYRYGSFTGFNFNTGKSSFLSSVRSLGVTVTK